MGSSLHGHDGVPGLVHGGARQIVHGGIDDAEVFFCAGLEVEHFAHANAGVAHEGSTRLQQDFALPHAARIQTFQHAVQQLVDGGRCLVVVGNAQPTAQVDVVQGDACGLHLLHQIQQAFHGFQIGGGLGHLRADMAVDTDDLQAGQTSRVLISSQHIGVGNAEFVAGQAGRDVRVGFGIDIGIDADAYGGAPAHFQRHGIEGVQLRQAFDIEAANAGFQGKAHLGACFAYARKDDGFGFGANQQRTLNFTSRNGVKTTVSAGK